MTVLRSALNVARGQSSWARLVRRALICALIIAVSGMLTSSTTSDVRRFALQAVATIASLNFWSLAIDLHRAHRNAAH